MAGIDGRSNPMILKVKKGKKVIAEAYMKGASKPGIDLKDVEPDTPKTITCPLMENGKKGLKEVGEIVIDVNFALIDQ